MSKVLVIDNTLRKDYSTCWRKGHFRHGLGLTTSLVPAPLNFNGAFHAGYAAWLRGEDKDTAISIALRSLRPQEADEKEWRTPDRLVGLLDAIFLEPKLSVMKTSDGTPLIEVDGAKPICTEVEDLDLQLRAQKLGFDGILYVFICDAITEEQGGIYIVDHTGCGRLVGNTKQGQKKTIPDSFWRQFKPNSQMAGYLWGVSAYLGKPINGCIINGIGCDQYGTSFERRMFLYTPSEVEEWRQKTLLFIGNYLTHLERGITTQDYNDDACMYFGRPCPYLEMCRLPERDREAMKRLYVVDHWSPLEARKKEAAQLGGEL